jgi:DNA (cytosine-5)-methyltransferase 1
MPTFGSLFAGIGGLDLGLERAGWSCRWQVERDEFCRSVLRSRWPAVRLEGDVVSVAFSALESVELIAGGFPCQDVSHAGRRPGIEGQQSGLWAHFARAIRELRPRFALVENVPGLLSGGMERILGDLAGLRYDAEWDCIPAAAIGAAHLRARIWILAYSGGDRVAADRPLFAGRPELDLCAGWAPEPAVARVADGLSARVGGRAINALGNAVVPQVAEWIGRRLMKAITS